MNEKNKQIADDVSLMIDRFSKDLDESTKGALKYGRELLFDFVKYTNDYRYIGKRNN